MDSQSSVTQSGVSGGAIAAIVIFVLIIVIFVVILAFFLGGEQTIQYFVINLSGSQVVPMSVSSASGSGTAVLDLNQGNFEYDITITGLNGSTGDTADLGNQFLGANGITGRRNNLMNASDISATFRRGARGNNGDIVKRVPFTVQESGVYRVSGNWSTDDTNQPLTEQDVDDLLNQRIYLLITTETFPDGAIRGQFIPDVNN